MENNYCRLHLFVDYMHVALACEEADQRKEDHGGEGALSSALLS